MTIKNKNQFNVLPSLLLGGVVLLTACTASQVALQHHSLETQTKMSDTVFLDPVPDAQKTIYVAVKNTSDQEVNVQDALKSDLTAHGYKVVNSLDSAHYILQANILSVSKMKPEEVSHALSGGYGSVLTGAVAGGAVGALSGNSTAALAGGIIGGVTGMVADSLVKDVNYAMITDVQVSERTNIKVTQDNKSDLKNGSSSMSVQRSTENSDFKRYRTRIASTADKVNLSFVDAKPSLEAGLVKSLSGIF